MQNQKEKNESLFLLFHAIFKKICNALTTKGVIKLLTSSLNFFDPLQPFLSKNAQRKNIKLKGKV